MGRSSNAEVADLTNKEKWEDSVICDVALGAWRVTRAFSYDL